MKTLCYTNTPFKMYATLHKSRAAQNKAVLLYFHGGGLIYGQRDDLPKAHLQHLLAEGFCVLSFDYRLCPVTKIPSIMEDVTAAVRYYLENAKSLFGQCLPYFLWGRSAGAYLCLLAAKSSFGQRPKGVISYYGYGLLADRWYEMPTNYYKAFPRLRTAEINHLTGHTEIIDAPLEKRYALYVHARQTGRWMSMIHSGSRKELLEHYSLRHCDTLSYYPPVFLAHSTQDPDVPFAEAELLSIHLPKVERYTVAQPTHDFDRMTGTLESRRLMDKTAAFIHQQLGA